MNQEIYYADYYVKNPKVDVDNFQEFWKQAEKSDYEKGEEKMELPYSNIKSAFENSSEIIGLEALNNIEAIDPSVKKYEFVNNIKIILIIYFLLSFKLFLMIRINS